MSRLIDFLGRKNYYIRWISSANLFDKNALVMAGVQEPCLKIFFDF
jgi:hypothetical protein